MNRFTVPALLAVLGLVAPAAALAEPCEFLYDEHFDINVYDPGGAWIGYGSASLSSMAPGSVKLMGTTYSFRGPMLVTGILPNKVYKVDAPASSSSKKITVHLEFTCEKGDEKVLGVKYWVDGGITVGSKDYRGRMYFCKGGDSFNPDQQPQCVTPDPRPFE